MRIFSRRNKKDSLIVEKANSEEALNEAIAKTTGSSRVYRHNPIRYSVEMETLQLYEQYRFFLKKIIGAVKCNIEFIPLHGWLKNLDNCIFLPEHTTEQKILISDFRKELQNLLVTFGYKERADGFVK